MNGSALQELVLLYPLYSIISASSAVAVLTAVLILLRVLKNLSLRKYLESMGSTLCPDMDSFHKRFSPRFLYGHSHMVEALSLKENEKLRVMELTGLDEIWIERFRKRHGKKDFERILQYAPGKGLFDCFLTSLKKKKSSEKLINWMKGSKEYLPLRKIALSGAGKEFHGEAAYQLLHGFIDEIREMTGDPEWSVRLFAARILLHDEDPRSARALTEALRDAHHSVRTLAAARYQETRQEHLENFYPALLKLALADPVKSVRHTAWQRISKDFSAIHTVDPSKLPEWELLHLLGLLDKTSRTDEALVFPYLESKNTEIRFAAARYLDSSGALRRLLLSLSPGDAEARERIIRLLSNAAELKMTAFLDVLKETDTLEKNSGREILSVCASVLKGSGPASAVSALCRNVFLLPVNSPEARALYHLTVEAACLRNDTGVLEEIKKELRRRRNEAEPAVIILDSLPRPVPETLLPLLFELFEDPSCAYVQAVSKILLEAESALVVRELFHIFDEKPESFPGDIKLRALKLLNELKLPYCLQTVLENLYLLPPEEARETGKILGEYPQEVLSSKLKKILESDDALLRAAVIRILPSAGGKDFLKDVRDAVSDADPDVRIAAVWAMVEYNDTRSLNKAVDMLRDPVERVRKAAARAIGAYGTNDLLKHLKEIINDANEVDPVRAAAAEGLGDSSSTLSVDILVQRLETEESILTEIIRALTRKIERKTLSRLMETFKDASPRLREQLVIVFKQMGEHGETAIEELLREDIPSLKPLAAEILEATGYIEKQIRTLSHRDPEIRRKAADFLSHAGTQAAFRGMVMAARDPDEEVRVMVIKALERLESGEEKEILEALSSDPDRKVRTYTAWALERIRAKNLKTEIIK